MVQIIQLLTAFFLSAFLVYQSIPIIVRLSNTKKLLDVPNKRKVNKHPIPNLGGIALFIGISLSTLLCIYQMPFADMRYILAAMIILFFIGMKDDILLIAPRKKLLAQVISALLLIMMGDIRITNLHGIIGMYEIGHLFSLLLSLLIIVGITNSINLIDGIDGLAAGLSIFISGIFGVAFILFGQPQYAVLSFSITGSLCAFFIYNVFGKANKIFMGDTGSLLLGVLFSVLVIKYNEFAITASAPIKNYSPAFSLALLFIPLFDMARVFCVRLFNKKSPFAPDMNHIHHKFLALGYSHIKATSIIVALNLLIIAVIYALRSVDINILLALLILFGIGVPYSPFLSKWIHKGIRRETIK